MSFQRSSHFQQNSHFTVADPIFPVTEQKTAQLPVDTSDKKQVEEWVNAIDEILFNLSEQNNIIQIIDSVIDLRTDMVEYAEHLSTNRDSGVREVNVLPTASTEQLKSS